MDALWSMELDDEDKLDTLQPIPMPSKPDFPYGLKLCLTMADFKNLKCEPPGSDEVGGMFEFRAMARITSINTSSDDGRQDCRVECQIEQMRICSEDGDDD